MENENNIIIEKEIIHENIKIIENTENIENITFINNESNLNTTIINEQSKIELTEEEKQQEELKEKEEKEEKRVKYKKLTKLKQKILNLSKNEYLEIFKILKKNKQKYSQNKNGIMFDFMKISNESVNDIIKFINYIEENNILVDKDEQTKNQYRNLIL